MFHFYDKLFLLTIIIIFICGCENKYSDVCNEVAQFEMLNFEGLQCYADIDDAMKCASKQIKPIFVLFTCFECVGDTRYEKILFAEDKNRNLIAENYIPVVLYVDAPTKLKESEKKMTILKKKELLINTLGRKNLNYQIEKFKTTTQPYLAILDEKGKIIIEPIGFQPDKVKYQEFLKKGISRRKYW